MKNRYCSETLGVHKKTLENAIVTCDERDDCLGIEDTDCDNDFFHLCKKGAIFKKGGPLQSCAYRKPGNQ